VSELVKIPFSALSIPANLTEHYLQVIPGLSQFFRIKQNYRSYLPLQLRKAEIIRDLLLANVQENFLEFEVKLSSLGYVDFTLTEHSLGLWLDYLSKNISQLQVNFQAQEEPDFLLHYTYARCCSLLRLGKQERIIKDDFYTQKISWLELTTIWEKAFFWQLLELSEKQITHSSLLKLAEVTMEVERYCRIWGEVQKKYPTLAKARLALFALSGDLLAYLVQQHFQIELRNEL